MVGKQYWLSAVILLAACIAMNLAKPWRTYEYSSCTDRSSKTNLSQPHAVGGGQLPVSIDRDAASAALVTQLQHGPKRVVKPNPPRTVSNPESLRCSTHAPEFSYSMRQACATAPSQDPTRWHFNVCFRYGDGTHAPAHRQPIIARSAAVLPRPRLFCLRRAKSTLRLWAIEVRASCVSARTAAAFS